MKIGPLCLEVTYTVSSALFVFSQWICLLGFVTSAGAVDQSALCADQSSGQ